MKVVANIYESNGYLPLIYGLMKKTNPDQMDRKQFSRWFHKAKIWRQPLWPQEDWGLPCCSNVAGAGQTSEQESLGGLNGW